MNFTHIREALGSNLDRDIGYLELGFTRFSSVPLGKLLGQNSGLGNLLHHFEFIIHQNIGRYTI
jgi:hypothetical protein